MRTQPGAAVSGLPEDVRWPATINRATQRRPSPSLRASLPPGSLIQDRDGHEKPNVAGLGESLYTTHLVTVGLAGILLFVALVGAVAITDPKRPDRPVRP